MIFIKFLFILFMIKYYGHSQQAISSYIYFTSGLTQSQSAVAANSWGGVFPLRLGDLMDFHLLTFYSSYSEKLKPFMQGNIVL